MERRNALIAPYETSGSGHSRRIKGGRRKSASPPIAFAPSRGNWRSRELGLKPKHL
jgi:hypothetical protein